jgi:spore coat protein U-like protein
MANAQRTFCSISVPAIHLGTYSGSRAATGVTPVSVICPAGMTYSISVRSGAGSSNTVRTLMGARGARLRYQLFRDAARTQNWGSEIGTDAVSGVGTGSTQRFNLYPALMQESLLPQGHYSDNVTVSVTSARGTYSASVPVMANSIGLCVSVSSSDLAFGNYSGSAVTASSGISLSCTAGLSIDIVLSAGTSPGATTSSRAMSGPNGATLAYSLYNDSALSSVWGLLSGTNSLTTITSGLLQSFTVYGKIPAGQIVAIGSYSDTVTATITY